MLNLIWNRLTARNTFRFGIAAATIVAAMFALPALAREGDAKRLLGGWSSVKVVGNPCANVIKTVEYYFSKDGSYQIISHMHSGMGTQRDEAIGTYAVKNNTITGKVKGAEIGPFKFWFEKDQLVIMHNHPSCFIYLKTLD